MQLVIGDDDTLHHPARSDAGTALATLIVSSRRSLWLRAPVLDALTDNVDVCNAIKTLALSSARADIRILFDHLGSAVRNGHRLIHLSRRLPSRITLRQTQQDDNDTQLCFAIADGTGLFEASGWPRPARLDLSGHRLPRAPRLGKQFREHWERAGGSQELRELRL
ncbi:hypothetical protein [Alcanivorax sp.]|jgi:hypothetical protein|uniref:DUF7931 domain-containing protein n=1 Tax=Alcanivorax sp. TaxID=1872427 RepID=UPI0032D953F9